MLLRAAVASVKLRLRLVELRGRVACALLLCCC